MFKEELELSRNNVTVSQFLAYVRHEIRAHGLTCIDAQGINLDYFRAGDDLNFDIKHDDPDMPEREISKSKPYEMQTYIKYRNGSVYNLIIEFNFDDENKGWGYFYFINFVA